MAIKIKNWSSFQHYKNRRPPWIRLYRDLLDDPDYHALTGDQAKALMLLWLIASEDEELQGNLPNVQKLSFRLRISEDEMINIIHGLTHWVEFNSDDVLASCYQDASEPLAKRLHVAIPESEGEGETEGEKKKNIYKKKKALDYPDSFLTFWQAYPKKIGKKSAYKAWETASKDGLPELDAVIAAIKAQQQSKQWKDPQYIPQPATWLNQGRWDDEISKEESSPYPSPSELDKMTAGERLYWKNRMSLEGSLADDPTENEFENRAANTIDI